MHLAFAMMHTGTSYMFVVALGCRATDQIQHARWDENGMIHTM